MRTAPRELPRDGAAYWGTQVQDGPRWAFGEPYMVRQMGSSAATKFYVCPGCNQNIPREWPMWWPGPGIPGPGPTTAGTGTRPAGTGARTLLGGLCQFQQHATGILGVDEVDAGATGADLGVS